MKEKDTGKKEDDYYGGRKNVASHPKANRDSAKMDSLHDKDVAPGCKWHKSI